MKLLWPALALPLLSRLRFADVQDDLGFASRLESPSAPAGSSVSSVSQCLSGKDPQKHTAVSSFPKCPSWIKPCPVTHSRGENCFLHSNTSPSGASRCPCLVLTPKIPTICSPRLRLEDQGFCFLFHHGVLAYLELSRSAWP